MEESEGEGKGGEEKGREKGERNERIEKDLARGPEGSH